MPVRTSDYQSWLVFQLKLEALQAEASELSGRFPLPTNLPDDVFSTLEEAARLAECCVGRLASALGVLDSQDAGDLDEVGDFLPECAYPY